MSRVRPEVLAPAGSPECLPAAVAGGADAVFLGLRHFNARGRAANFRKADLPRHVAYLHGHGLKCYVVLNTLVHDDEHPKALELARAAHESGVDAVIVQDLGLWTLIGRELPGLERHASTQMTVHHPSQIAVLARLGAARVILARELALSEVAACVLAGRAVGVEVEHFVHGALCYAFSGQCLMSNFAGCRSANRGTCAQNCRFDYERGPGFAAVSGPPSTEISMRDLQLIDRVAELADAGVVSLKIEGRLKGPEYVYTVSKAYRAATEAWLAARAKLPAPAQAPITAQAAATRAQLRDVFARANDDAPLRGDYSDKARLHRYQPAQDLVADATVIACDRKAGEMTIACAQPVVSGQGFAFSVGSFNGGFLVIHAERARQAGQWRLRVRIAPRGPALPVGLALFRNVDHQRRQEAQAEMALVPLPRPAEDGVEVELSVTGAVGGPLAVTAVSADGRHAETASAQPLAAAQRSPLDEAALRESLGALGGSGFRLDRMSVQITGQAFLPQALLKRMRRELVTRLGAQAPVVAPETAAALAELATPRRRETRLWVVVGSLAAARQALEAGADQVWLDDPLLDWWGAQAPSLDLTGFAAGTLWLRLPATSPPSPHLAALGLPVVAGHLGVLADATAAGLAVVADAPLNVFSTVTAQALAALGAQAVVISLECSSREIARFAARLGDGPGPALAMIAAGRVPAMLTRQDHGLALGAVGALRATDADGGLPYQLQRRHHDTVIWEGRRLCAPEQVAVTTGLVDAWILELADLTGDALREVIAAYRRLRAGGDPEDVRLVQERHATDGLFSGHLHRGSRELDAIAHEAASQHAQSELEDVISSAESP